MAEFQELIKNFDRIRDYMRQFYVYGFKSRNDFDAKSARTYDNERRRIESWLGNHTRSDYTAKGKHVYINVDSKMVPQNPLYAAWKSKSFTDNDILLHFFILDQLWEHPEGMTASSMSDAISLTYGVVFDAQTVRLKLKEYDSLGLLCSHKEGKTLLYQMIPPMFPEDSPVWEKLLTAVSFFQETAPFGFVGSTLLDWNNEKNEIFQFKHHFIVHTLEDKILLDALTAMREHRSITYENKSSRTGNITSHTGIPLKIFVSTRTGRRYLCLYLPELRRFHNARLDSILSITSEEFCEDYEPLQNALQDNLTRCWGVSFGNSGKRLETVCLRLFIDEEKDPHVLNRLYREGKGGEVLKIREHEYLYTGAFFDTNEMLSWIKTFTGRILDIQGTSEVSIFKVTRDWERMYQMYFKEEKENPHGTV
ncbi:MAG: WYL domain-containing protein [Hungatella sp.]